MISIGGMKEYRSDLIVAMQKNISKFMGSFPIHSGIEFTDVLDGDVECIYSGFKTYFLNNIFGGNPCKNDFLKNALKVVSFFAQKNASCTWWVYELGDIACKIKSMAEIGFYDFTKLTIMSMRLESIKPLQYTHSRFHVKAVDCQNDFEEFFNIYSSPIYGSYKEDMASYRSSLIEGNIFSSGRIKFFVGFNDLTPVCIGSLCMHDGVAGIYDVFTLPAYRKKGFAALLVVEMLLCAKRHGCETSILQSTDDALGLYRFLGFEQIESSLVFNNESFMHKFNAVRQII